MISNKKFKNRQTKTSNRQTSLYLREAKGTDEATSRVTLLAELRGRGEGSILNSATFKQSPQKQKIAFTLAEVLITLGIIGVVAALTLPMLIQNYQKKFCRYNLKSFIQHFIMPLNMFKPLMELR